MRKIKRFKIAPRQREILRRLLRELPLLRRAGFTSEAEVSAFILSIFKLLDPGVVYEFNQDAHWELDEESTYGEYCIDYNIEIGRASCRERV